MVNVVGMNRRRLMVGAVAVLLAGISSWRLYVLSGVYPEASRGLHLMAAVGFALTGLLAFMAWWSSRSS